MVAAWIAGLAVALVVVILVWFARTSPRPQRAVATNGGDGAATWAGGSDCDSGSSSGDGGCGGDGGGGGGD